MTLALSPIFEFFWATPTCQSLVHIVEDYSNLLYIGAFSHLSPKVDSLANCTLAHQAFIQSLTWSTFIYLFVSSLSLCFSVNDNSENLTLIGAIANGLWSLLLLLWRLFL